MPVWALKVAFPLISILDSGVSFMQLNNNPHQEQVERLWLLLCLVVVAFPTGKAFYKYFVSFLQSSLGGPGQQADRA